MLEKALFLLSLAALAVVYADVLVRPGMLLEPVQRWVRDKYRWCDASGPYPVLVELDDQWWWPPLWGCYKCVSGWAGAIGYVAHYWRTYNLFEHLAFTAFAIIAAIILHKWTQE